jgi:hypothetical protein
MTRRRFSETARLSAWRKLRGAVSFVLAIIAFLAERRFAAMRFVSGTGAKSVGIVPSAPNIDKNRRWEDA